MRKGLLAAATAAIALACAGQAAAATFTVDFTISGPWTNWLGSGDPFGLTGSPVISGSLSGDTALLTTPPGPYGGTETLTALNLVAGSHTFALTDIDAASSWVQFTAGSVLVFGLDLGSAGFVSNNNTASFSDGLDGIYCNGCVRTDSVTWAGLDPTPEPATWAMMLLGFFGLGAVLRGRRSATLPA